MSAAIYGDECGHAAPDEVCPICTPDRRAPSDTESRLRASNTQLAEALRDVLEGCELRGLSQPGAWPHDAGLIERARAALTAAGVAP